MTIYSASDLLMFKSTNTVNPTTNRKIKPGSKIYKNLQRQLSVLETLLNKVVFVQQRFRYRRYRSLQLRFIRQSVNNHSVDPSSTDPGSTDPISLEPIRMIPPSCVCGIIINNTRHLYHINSIQQLTLNNITTCPLTRHPIPAKTLHYMATVTRAYTRVVPTHDSMDKSMEESIEALTKDVFHEFTLESIYLDHTAFLRLNTTKLKTLHYEWKEMFDKNTTPDQKRSILGTATVFPPVIITDKHQYHRYLVNQLATLLRPLDASLKTLLTYIMLGGLTLVCPQYAHYRQYCFDF